MRPTDVKVLTVQPSAQAALHNPPAATESQRTVAAPVTVSGIGVHSGASTSLTLRPADPGTGIRFRRIDLPDEPEIPARVEYVVGTDLGTSLGAGEARALTVEHVMAALYAYGVDNCTLDLDGPEPPIGDGSFKTYADAILSTGLTDQDEPARVLTVNDPVSVNANNGESYVVAPSPDYRVAACIDFTHPAIGKQFGSFELTPEVWATELAPARTFGFKAEAEALMARGLARGASLENTIVLDDEGLMNDSLRFEDEYVRHKIGDLVGDLALVGARIRGRVVAERPSHAGNVALARVLSEMHRKAEASAIVDTAKIMEYLPHRYPMLLVDRIIEFETGKRIVGIKNVTINEPFFQGHYPGHPIMPGVLIIEAMAQVGGLLLMDTVPNPEEKVVYFMSLDNVKWRRPVTPGDQIVFEIEMIQKRRKVCRMSGKGYVDGNLVAEAELMATIMDR